jgi:hypothetical protein
MGLEKFKPGERNMARPAKVEIAVRSGDKEALSRFGRAGARAKIENEDAARFIAEHKQERLAAEELERRRQAGEDILPPSNID